MQVYRVAEQTRDHACSIPPKKLIVDRQRSRQVGRLHDTSAEQTAMAQHHHPRHRVPGTADTLSDRGGGARMTHQAGAEQESSEEMRSSNPLSPCPWLLLRFPFPRVRVRFRYSTGDGTSSNLTSHVLIGDSV